MVRKPYVRQVDREIWAARDGKPPPWRRAAKSRGGADAKACRAAAEAYKGKNKFMLDMKKNALWDDDWYPTPKQILVIKRILHQERAILGNE